MKRKNQEKIAKLFGIEIRPKTLEENREEVREYDFLKEESIPWYQNSELLIKYAFYANIGITLLYLLTFIISFNPIWLVLVVLYSSLAWFAYKYREEK